MVTRIMKAKRGKLLAAVAVLAMVFAAFAVVSVGDDSDATGSGSSGSVEKVPYIEGEYGFDLVINKDIYLSADTIVKEGVTFTVKSGGALHLNGFQLVLNGNLVVEKNGSVDGLKTTESGKDGNGQPTITLMKTGSIENSGVLGKEVGITVKAGGVQASDGYNGVGSVAINDVAGINFGLKRSISGSEPNKTINYTLTMSGEVVKKSNDAKITCADGVIVNSDMYIPKGVAITGKMVISGATLTVDGTIEGETSEKNNIGILVEKGSKIVINGDSKADISAYTGAILAQGADISTMDLTTIYVEDIKGLTIEVVSETFTEKSGKDVKKYIEQRLVLSGELTDSKVAGAGETTNPNIDIDGVAANPVISKPYVGVYIIDRLVVDDSIESFQISTGKEKVTVLGTLEFEDENKIPESAYGVFIGAVYTVSVVGDNGVTQKTMFVKSFDAALADIDNAAEKTIYVYGDVEIDDLVELTGEWSVTGGADYKITENGKVLVGGDATFETTSAITVDGMLEVKDGGVVSQDIDYDAKTENDAGDITYSGIAVALKNSSPGDKIELTEGADVEGSLTIPADRTVTVPADKTLTIGEDLTVIGSLELKSGATLAFSGEEAKMTVSGNVDVSEGSVTNSSFTGDKALEMTVTGTVIAGADAFTEMNVNAVYYENEDQNIVYTTLASAIAGVMELDVIDKEVIQVGKVTDTTAVTLDGVDLIIDGEYAVFGDITLKDATITVGKNNVNECPLTAKIIGAYGEEGKTSEASVILEKVKVATIKNDSRSDEMNVTIWYNEILFDEGKVTIDSGEVELSNITINSAEFNKASQLIISEGATLTMSSNVTVVDAEYLTIEGTLLVKEGATLTVSSSMTIVGDLVVEGKVSVKGTTADGTTITGGILTIDGSLVVDDSEDSTSEFVVEGRLNIGAVPETLGSTDVVVSGKISASGSVVVFPGASIENAKIMNGTQDAVSTKFIVNGVEYATVYNALPLGFDAEILNLDDLSAIEIKWKANGEDVVASVGIYEELSADIKYAGVDFKVSAGPGLEIYIDDVKNELGTANLTIGEHTITVYVKANYEGSPEITINGQEVTDGKFTVTTDMLGEDNLIHATGATPIDYNGGSSSDSGMGITDYLLIILVVMVVILAIVVIMRMMRS